MKNLRILKKGINVEFEFGDEEYSLYIPTHAIHGVQKESYGIYGTEVSVTIRTEFVKEFTLTITKELWTDLINMLDK